MNGGIRKLSDITWWQRQCLDDLYFFCRTVLITLEDTSPGFKDLFYPTHKRICNFVSHYAYEGQKLLILTPRHWIKSYIITLGWYLQRILRNIIIGNREIGVISNATYPNSMEFLRRIKFNIQYNDLLRGFFSDHLPRDPDSDATEWTKDCIELSGNRVELGSVEKNLVSRHYFIMINDDLVNRDNSLTAAGLNSTHDWWGLSHSLLHPRGIELNVGTRWSIDDNYGQIMSKFCPPPSEKVYEKAWSEWHNGSYHVLHINCWEDPIHEKGSTFPNLFPEEKLHELKLQLGDRFYGQYENNPMNTGKNPFKGEWIKRWHPQGVPVVRYTMMLIDSSGKAKKDESSASGVVIMEMCPDKRIYIQYGKALMISDRTLAEKIVDLSMQYRPDMIGVEDVKFYSLYDLIELVVEERLRRLQVNKEDAEYMKLIPRMMIELKPKGRPKPVRIKQLTGFFEAGNILLPYTGAEDLEEEYRRYPSIKDDVLDALAYVLDVGIYPKHDEPPKILIVPEKLKMTQEERIEDEWEKYREEGYVDVPPMDEEDNAGWLGD